jgi:hypothetical protein
MSLCRLEEGNIVLKRFPGLGLPMLDTGSKTDIKSNHYQRPLLGR